MAEPNAPPDSEGDDEQENRDDGCDPGRWSRRLGWWLLITVQAIIIATTGEVVAEAVIRALL